LTLPIHLDRLITCDIIHCFTQNLHLNKINIDAKLKAMLLIRKYLVYHEQKLSKATKEEKQLIWVPHIISISSCVNDVVRWLIWRTFRYILVIHWRPRPHVITYLHELCFNDRIVRVLGVKSFSSSFDDRIHGWFRPH
jgi:hypothetical protein